MTISQILARKGRWYVDLNKTVIFQASIFTTYPKDFLEEKKPIWKRELQYQLGLNTWFLFEDNVFWEFYNENDWCKKLFFTVDEQARIIKLYKHETCVGEPLLAFDVLQISSSMLVFYVAEDNSFDDFSHHKLIILCDFIEPNSSKNMENNITIHYFPFTSDASHLHEYAGQQVEVRGDLFSEIREGAVRTEIYAGFDAEYGKISVSKVLFLRNEVVSLKRYLFFSHNLKDNSFNIRENQSTAVDAEKPTYFSVVLFAKEGVTLYHDEISVEELSKTLQLETYAALEFDTLQDAEAFVAFLQIHYLDV